MHPNRLDVQSRFFFYPPGDDEPERWLRLAVHVRSADVAEFDGEERGRFDRRLRALAYKTVLPEQLDGFVAGAMHADLGVRHDPVAVLEADSRAEVHAERVR